MRKIINKYLIKNQEYLKNKIVFLHNDLWSFSSKDLCFAKDLVCSENLIWSFAYGQYLSGKLPIVYGVSFFQIGRLEQLRKFFGFNKAPLLIINAGAIGYDKYGWEHAFKNKDDIKIMKALGFKILNLKKYKSKKDLKKILFETLESYVSQNVSQKNKENFYKNIYIRLYKDL